MMAFNTLWGLIGGLPGLAAAFRSGLKSSTDLRLENATLRVQIQMLEDKLKSLGNKRFANRPDRRCQEQLRFPPRMDHPVIR